MFDDVFFEHSCLSSIIFCEAFCMHDDVHLPFCGLDRNVLCSPRDGLVSSELRKLLIGFAKNLEKC